MQNIKRNRIYVVVGVVLCDLLAVIGLLVYIIGFGLLTNTVGSSPADFVGISSFPLWALAVGTPFALFAFLAHAVIIAVEKLRKNKIIKAIFSGILTVLFVWMLANAGGVLHFTSIRLNTADLESAYAASFAGSLILTVFGGLTFAATLISVFPDDIDDSE